LRVLDRDFEISFLAGIGGFPSNLCAVAAETGETEVMNGFDMDTRHLSPMLEPAPTG
jgi:hypothetical protein